MTAAVYESRLITAVKPAWWDYEGSHVYTTPIELVEAGQQAGVYVQYEKRPMFTTLEDGDDAPTIIVPNRQALVRASSYQMDGPGVFKMDEDGQPVLSPAAYLIDVDPGYPIMQNRDICERLNPITRPRTDGGEWWPVDSIGLLHNGATLIISLNMGGWELVGEHYAKRMGLIENRTGSAMVMMVTFTRMVCQNTAIAALDSAEFIIRIPHNKEFLRNADAAMKLMVRANVVADQFSELATKLSQDRLFATEASEIAARVWPEPKKPELVQRFEDLSQRGVSTDDVAATIKRAEKKWETDRLRMIRRQDMSLELYDKIADESPLGLSSWAYYQAVVQVCDHEKGRGDRALSTLIGDRADAKNTALELLAARVV